MEKRTAILSSVSTILIFFLLSVSQAQQEPLSQVNDPDEYWEELNRRDEEKRKAAIKAAAERRREAIEKIKPLMVEIPSEIANSIVLTRQFIDDLGMTVEQAIQSLYLKEGLDKDELCHWESGWFSTTNEYSLVCKFRSQIRITFTPNSDNSTVMVKFYSFKLRKYLPAELAAATFF